MRAKHLVALPTLPAQQHLASLFFQDKILERRQDTANLLDDQFIAFAIRIAQIQQHRRQIAAIRAQAERLGDIPALMDVRKRGRIMKLVSDTPAEKTSRQTNSY